MFRIFVVIFLIYTVELFSTEKIEYLFCNEENRISERIDELIINLKSKNVKKFVEMFTENMFIYCYNKHYRNSKKEDFLRYENKELNMNDEMSILYGIFFDNDFTKREFNRFSYSNGNFSVLIYQLPYDLPAIKKNMDENTRKKYYSQLPLYNIILYWDKIDLTSINISIDREYNISSIKSYYSIGVTNNTENYKQLFYVGENNVAYNDIEQKKLVSQIKRNTEIEIVKIFDDKYMKHSFKGEMIQSNAVFVKSIPEGKSFYIPWFLISKISDEKENLINWKKWIYEEW